MKKIKLTQEREALVDDIDYEELNKYKWYYGGGYARRDTRESDGTRKRLLMHREIISSDTCVDHIDGNGLNNQRHNLRVATYQQNNTNRRKQDGFTSKYKGVAWCKRENKWRAYIKINGKFKSLGYFDNEIIAAKKYNQIAQELFGEYALLNII